MCGRVKLEGDFSELKIKFSIPPDHPAPNYAPSWNVAPTDKLPIVHYNPKTEARALDLMRWGLVPYWAKDFKIGFSTINAMAETVDTKPVPRGIQAPALSRTGRGLLRMEETRRQDQAALRLRPRGRRHYGARGSVGDLEIAGRGTGSQLHHRYHDAERAVRRGHNRMPVILPPSVWPAWLGEDNVDGQAALKSLLAPYPAVGMAMWPLARVSAMSETTTRR